MHLHGIDVSAWLGAGPLGVLLGFIGKTVADRRTETRRRQHERGMRLLDTAVEASAAFLSAAERLAKTRIGVAQLWITHDAARDQKNEAAFQENRMKLESARQKEGEVEAEADAALTSIYLLAGREVGHLAHEYLEACRTAWYPDESRDERFRLREAVEDHLRRHLVDGR